jgi:hypothetical protein
MDTIPISVDLLKYIGSGVVTAISAVAAFRDFIIIREKTKDIANSTNAMIFKEVDKVLGNIVEEILVNYQSIADEEWPAIRNKLHTAVDQKVIDDYYQLQMGTVETIVNDTFFGRIRTQTIQNIQINSYHEMSDRELENYFDETGRELYDTVVRVLMSKGIGRIAILNGRIGEKYKSENAIVAYKSLIEFVLRVEHIRDEKIKKIKKERSIMGKIATALKGWKNG